MKENFENRTMNELKAMLNDYVEKYNASVDTTEKIDLTLDIKDAVDAINELSLLTVYADCLNDEQPLMKFASTYYYDFISVKYSVQPVVIDGKSRKINVATINESDKKMSLFKFIEWTKNRNKLVTADKYYIVKVADARSAITKEWKKFMDAEDGETMSKKAIKAAMQEAFNALVFIKGASGNNAVIANKNIANYVIALAANVKVTSKDKKPTFKVEFLGKNWEGILFDALHMAIDGKTFEVSYGEDAVEAEAEAPAEAKPAAKKNGKKSK